ncbi:MAG: PD-(D/E)XK motif protein [Leptolyngbyaceae cyanobacterium CSU_1_3]|nr:PD-(D/E)XK motif protein [Leptolyngbyaceae cyanobacterium CSU_1_3]
MNNQNLVSKKYFMVVIRQHHFSLEQLQSPPETETLVASIFVERSQAGKSIWELLLQIRSRCTDRLDLVLRLDEVVSYTLGDNWRKIMDERFSDKIAKQSLQFYRAADVPSVSSDLPVGVSNVRFLSDLSGVLPINAAIYRAKNGLFRWAL